MEAPMWNFDDFKDAPRRIKAHTDKDPNSKEYKDIQNRERKKRQKAKNARQNRKNAIKRRAHNGQ